MKILGIVAEYDPFHNGHARHLRLARDAVRPDLTYIALSGCLKQRGELALLSPYDRARCALEHGADAVFALPAAWTVRDAEHYALGAVSLLRDLGVTHLAFGAETGDLERLRRAAEALERPEEAFSARLRENLAAGMGYARAVHLAVAEGNPDLGEVLRHPNNTLAVCYLRAISQLNAQIEPVLIPREGGYHAEIIDPDQPSASAIRAALERGAYEPAYAAVPKVTEGVLRRAFLDAAIPRSEVYHQLLLRRLRALSREEARGLPDVSEGLEDRLMMAARQAGTFDALLDEVSGRRYPRSRVRRICAWALLEETEEALQVSPLPRQALLLGLHRNPEMTGLWRKLPLEITSEWTEETDLKAWRLWAQCTGQADTLPWTERVVSLPEGCPKTEKGLP